MASAKEEFTQELISRTLRLRDEVDALVFTYDGYIYNPLDYAWDMHRTFLERYVRPGAGILMLGMNPGPF